MANQVLLPQSRYYGGNPYAPSNGSYYATPTPQPQQSGGGGLNLPNIPNFNGFGGGSGRLAQLTNQINGFGANLGFSPGGLAYTGIGPSALPWAQPGMTAPSFMAGTPGVEAATGSLGTSATLSGTLGAAGLGSLAGGFLGKIGGNSTGGSIGGGIGAAIGNMILPGVGGVIGGLLGGIGGGFFGSKKPGVIASEFGGTLTGGGLTGVGFGSKRASTEFAQGLSGELGNYFDGAAKYLGIQFKDIGIRGGYNDRYMGGAFITINGQDIRFNADDPKSKNAAIDQALSIAAKLSGATDDKIASMLDYLNNPKAQQTMIPAKQTSSNSSNFQQFLENYKAKINGPAQSTDTASAATTTEPATA